MLKIAIQIPITKFKTNTSFYLCMRADEYLVLSEVRHQFQECIPASGKNVEATGRLPLTPLPGLVSPPSTRRRNLCNRW